LSKAKGKWKSVVREFTPTLDGLALAPAQMSDDSHITDTIADNIAAKLFGE